MQFGQFGLTRLNGSPPFEIGGWTFFFLAAILAAAAVHAASAFDTHDDAAGGGWRGLRTKSAANGWVIFGRRLRHTVCISCWLLQTSKVPSSLCIWHKARLLTKAGAYRGGVVLIVDRCLAVAMTVPEGIGHHPTVGEPAMQWVDFLTFRGRQEKSPDSCESGLFIWCRRD